MKQVSKRGLLSLASTMLLTGCANLTAATVSLKAVCGTDTQQFKDGSWQGISVSKDDKLTKGTAGEILGNNAAHDKVCGVKPKQSAANYP